MSENLGMFRSPQQDLSNGIVFDIGNLPVVDISAREKQPHSCAITLNTCDKLASYGKLCRCARESHNGQGGTS